MVALASSVSSPVAAAEPATATAPAPLPVAPPPPLEPALLDLDAGQWSAPPVGCARWASRGGLLPGPAARYAHSATAFRGAFLILHAGFASPPGEWRR